MQYWKKYLMLDPDDFWSLLRQEMNQTTEKQEELIELNRMFRDVLPRNLIFYAAQGPKGITEARKDLAQLRTTINASPDDSWRDHFIERLDEYESLFPYEQPSEKDKEN